MLYRKYRPQTFSQVVGQEHVVKTLKGALLTGRTGHAYLFSGPRGTGKTTIARIFAKALNCPDWQSQSRIPDSSKTNRDAKDVPCNVCDACLAVNGGRSLDLIEIDAASNRGIEDIRNLKDSALVAAPGGNYKVFIVDEVHMLTKDAFNALLKILEEPPSHTVFILATTEPHKILPTVLSRVQRFDFRRLTVRQISEKIKEVAKTEKINIDDEGIKAIAASCDGALRDAEVSLSKIQSSISGGDNITADNVNEILGLISFSYYPQFFNYLVNGDKASAVHLVHKIYESGIDLEHFAKEFIEYLRKIMISKINPATLAAVGEEPVGQISPEITGQKLVRMINAFSAARNEIKASPIPQLPLELAIMELTE